MSNPLCKCGHSQFTHRLAGQKECRTCGKKNCSRFRRAIPEKERAEYRKEMVGK
jgi:hypothetical protein